MNRVYVLIIRALLGGFFAVLLVRMFYPQKPFGWTVALAVFLVGMAYLFEYFGKNKTNNPP